MVGSDCVSLPLEECMDQLAARIGVGVRVSLQVITMASDRLGCMGFVFMSGVAAHIVSQDAEKAASIVLASLRPSRTPESTPRPFAHCGLAGRPF